MRIFNRLLARIGGEYAVLVSGQYHVYKIGEVSLERLKEIFPGLPIYRRVEGGWLRI